MQDNISRQFNELKNQINNNKNSTLPKRLKFYGLALDFSAETLEARKQWN